MKELIEQIKKARYVFLCGNGGSSATAEHITSDLFARGIKAICLNSNNAIMTMIANDFGYEYVFSKQLDVFATKDDLLIVISGSGNSQNILEALYDTKYKTFGLLGMGGGEAINLVDHFILVPSENYGKIEDEHLAIGHKIKELL